jgi:hypothetical protein
LLVLLLLIESFPRVINACDDREQNEQHNQERFLRLAQLGVFENHQHAHEDREIHHSHFDRFGNAAPERSTGHHQLL